MHVIDQTDFIVPMAFIIDRIDDQTIGKQMIVNFVLGSELYSRSIGKWLHAKDINEAINKAEYRIDSLLFAIYGELANKVGKQICGDKSVSDIGYYPILARAGLFNSKVKIVHIVRDVRAVYSSLERLDWVKDRKVFPRSWSNSNLGLHQLLKNSENYHFLRYEDLVVDSQNVLGGVCSFLGFDFEKTMLDNDKRGMEYLGESYHNNLQKPFMEENIRKWETDLSIDNQSLCELQAAESLEFFGYL
jgi:hypothetical protein